MLTTELCRSLDIEHPVLSAGMGSVTGPELAAAVSNAGGLGQVVITGMDRPTAEARIRATLDLTDRSFAANVILDIWKGHEIEAALAAGAPAIFLFWGDFSQYADEIHRAGAKLIVQIGLVAEAVAARDAGADVIVAQGVEAGGHVRGTTPLFSLLPAVVEAVSPLPVAAAGGILDGRGLAAAMSLGGQGVLMGTRFLASNEAFIHPEYQARILAATDDSTVYAEDLFDVGWPSAPHRMLRNRVVAEWEAAGKPSMGSREGEGSIIGRSGFSGRSVEIARFTSFTASPAFEGDMEEVSLWAGTSVGLVTEVRPAGDIVRETVQEAEAILTGLSRGGLG